MNFSFSGRHMEIGESLTNRAKNACIALADKYGIDFIDLCIVMKKNNYLFDCDVTAKTNTGNSYYASNSANDPNACFDGTLQKIDLQMRKKKKNIRSATAKESGKMIINSYDNSLEEENSPIIVAEVLKDLPLLSVSDAADLLHEQKRVMVFENIANRSVNVVYKRDDGNIGWIDYKNPYEVA
ncbi:MAG: HPF/RaiA family ribosome-associated protein [Holosporaceae bacterium]|jgi:ribosomal subunit interface protein|nr:HPF/RaiA family ribosome-associated protein [Holosporaceae bacterium]